MRPPEHPESILVICIRRIGDVLLSTALIHSLKRQWPQARIDVLVNAGSAIALEGNPDIHQLIIHPEKPSFWQLLRLVCRLFRRYSLSVSTLYSDRPHLFSFIASSRRAGVLPPAGHVGHDWKKFITHYPAEYLLGPAHAIQQYLAVIKSLGIPALARVIAPRPPDETRLSDSLGEDWKHSRYAVLHPSPMYAYKQWTLTGWVSLTQHLTQHGLKVIFTGGKSEHEIRLVEDILRESNANGINLAGKLRFCELTPLIQHAQVFVGPDTSVTHLAAATGTPTVAIFGPSPTPAWGPWPMDDTIDTPSPWEKTAPLQQRGNVSIIQGVAACVPCMKEGCDNHLNSHSRCLDELPPQRVTLVIDQILKTSMP